MKISTKLVAALLMLGACTAQAASVAIGSASSSGVTAVITADASERGTAKLYVAVAYGGNLFFRGSSTSSWVGFTGGSFPDAGTLTLTGSAQTVTITDFDLSSLPGLDVYVGYGATVADLSKAGHLAKIYTVPAATKPTTPTPPSSNAVCDTSQAPSGVSYSQSGNTVNITTNGQCVPLPTTASLCSPPQSSSSSSGQSVLTTMNISSFSLTGISFNIPGMPNPFNSLAQGLGASSTCLRNAPQGYSSYNMNLDVCYDITAALGSSLSAYQGNPYISISSPITEKLKGSFTSTVVSDCFATSATSVIDVATQEVWIKQGTSFTKVR